MTKKVLKAMFAEGIQSSIRMTLSQWWAAHQNASLENLTQNATFYSTYKDKRLARKVEVYRQKIT